MKKFISLATLALLPFVASAQTIGLDNLIVQFGNTLQKLIPIGIILAILAFFYSIFEFLRNREDKEKADSFKKQILWELLALILLFGWFGFVKIGANTLGIGSAIGQDINQNDLPLVHF